MHISLALLVPSIVGVMGTIVVSSTAMRGHKMHRFASRQARASSCIESAIFTSHGPLMSIVHDFTARNNFPIEVIAVYCLLHGGTRDTGRGEKRQYECLMFAKNSTDPWRS